MNLKKAVDDGKLIFFANENILMPYNAEEAELLIADIDSLKLRGLKINKEKTNAITNIQSFPVGSTISGVEFFEKVK